MAIVKVRRTKLASSLREYRQNAESTEFANVSFMSVEQLKKHFKYLNSKKEYDIPAERLIQSYGGDVIDDNTRMKLVVQDVIPDAMLPHHYLHLSPEEYEMKLDDAAGLYAETVAIHNEYYRIQNGDKSTTQSDEIFFSFALSEMAGLNLEQIRDRASQYVDAFSRPYIGENYKSRKPWLQIHPKPNGIVDCHLLLAYYDDRGQKLRSLRSLPDLEEKSNIQYQLEQSGRFPWLEMTITDSWVKQGKLTTPDQVPDEVAKLKEILSATPDRPDLTQRALIDAGAKITGHRYGNKTEFTSIDFNGVKFIVDKDFDSELNVMLSTYLEFKDFAKGNKKVKVSDVTSQLTEIINRMKGKSLEELNNELLKEGICMKLNPNKAKQVRGISFDFGNNTTIKSARIGFKKEDFKIEYQTYSNLIAAHNKFSEVVTEIKHNGAYKQKDFAYIGNGKPTKISTYEEWRMKENESLFAFQRRMRASNNSKALIAMTTYEVPSPFLNIIYHTNTRGTKKKVAQILDDKTIRVFGTTPSALKAGLQLFHAKNRLSYEEAAQGYKHRIEISGRDLEALNKAWLQAKLLGYEPVVKIKGSESLEFTPTISTMEAYDAELKKQRDKHRKANASNLSTYFTSGKVIEDNQHVTDPSFRPTKLTLNYFNSLGNDVDRSALALTYLDAHKLSVDTKHLFNPPFVHKNSRNRLTVTDLVKHYDLILSTARKEIPGEYDAFKAELDRVTGKVKPTPANELQRQAKPLPPVPAAKPTRVIEPDDQKKTKSKPQ